MGTIVENLEEFITDVSHEVSYVKSIQSDLTAQLPELIRENERLNKEINTLKSSNIGDHSFANDIIENLKQQITTLLEEKSSVMQLYQNSMTCIGNLENELSTYQTGDHDVVSKNVFRKMKRTYEDNIRNMEEKLEGVQKLYKEQTEIKSKDVDEALKTQNNALKIVKNLEDEILVLQKRLQDLECMNNDLHAIAKESNSLIQKLTKENCECKYRVDEALVLVEAALNEKDAALFRQRQLQDELTRVHNELSTIFTNNEIKIKSEVTQANMDYVRKTEELLNQLMESQSEIKKKSLEIEQISAKCRFLEDEVNKLQKVTNDSGDSSCSKLLLLQKNFESTFQKLLVSEKLNIQLVSEKEMIQKDMEQMADLYERALKAKDIENKSLQQRLKLCEKQLDEEKNLLNSMKKQLDTAVMERNSIERELNFEKSDLEKSLTEKCTKRIEEMATAYDATITDLQHQLHTKDQMNKKWTTETKTIIANLEKLVLDMKAEVHRSRKDNKMLTLQLKETFNKFQHYKGFLQVVLQDVNRVTSKISNNIDIAS